ncbi:MAG: outer membrane beta-barrel protein [Planctomycetes bacterium]|nr:outer membrane beta-barrel protein [Planctomycetota bacterium]
MQNVNVRTAFAVGLGLILAAGSAAWAQEASQASSLGVLTPAMMGQAAAAEQPTEAPPPAPAPASSMSKFFTETQVNGALSASYLYNFNRPTGDVTAGRSFDVNHDEFALNKFKVILQNPVDYSPDNWDAGYYVDVNFGQDATLLQAAGLTLGANGDLEEAAITVNVPVGQGLKVSMGKWVTLMGVEVIEEWLNPTWSEGNQFLLAENFTALGVQLEYRFTDWLETKARLTNGWDVVKDNNDAMSLMGQILLKPFQDDKTVLSIVPYGGPEQPAATNTATAGAWRKGINLVGYQRVDFGDQALHAWAQFDYGHEDENTALPDPTDDAEWIAVGLWLKFDVNKWLALSGRWDYFNDADGARTSGAPFTNPFPPNTGQELYSLTFTVNLYPLQTPDLQVRPEIRWDHSTEENAFDGDEEDQVTIGFGTHFLF